MAKQEFIYIRSELHEFYYLIEYENALCVYVRHRKGQVTNSFTSPSTRCVFASRGITVLIFPRFQFKFVCFQLNWRQWKLDRECEKDIIWNVSDWRTYTLNYVNKCTVWMKKKSNNNRFLHWLYHRENSTIWHWSNDKKEHTLKHKCEHYYRISLVPFANQPIRLTTSILPMHFTYRPESMALIGTLCVCCTFGNSWTWKRKQIKFKYSEVASAFWVV